MRHPWSVVIVVALLSVSAAPLVLAAPGGNGNGNGGGPPADDDATSTGGGAGEDRDRREDVEDGDVDKAEGYHGNPQGAKDEPAPPEPEPTPEPTPTPQPTATPTPDAEPEPAPEPEPEPAPEPEPTPKPTPQPTAEPTPTPQPTPAPTPDATPTPEPTPQRASEPAPPTPPQEEPTADEPAEEPPEDAREERPTPKPATPERAPPRAETAQPAFAASAPAPAHHEDEPIALASIEDAPEESAQPEVRVVRGARPVDVAAGVVNVTSSYEGDPARVRLVLVHPNGTEETLARGSTQAPWDTRAHSNGGYTVELRERDDDAGGEVTVASTYVRVENPRAAMPAAIAAIATGAAGSAGAAFLAARGVDVLTVLKHAGVDLTVEAAEDQVRRRTSRWDKFARQGRVAMAGLILVASLLLAAFQVWADAPRVAEFLASLPIMGSAVVLVTLAHYGLETALARVTGARSRFRLWTAGALTLAASALIFRSPFGHPGYVEEADAPQRNADEREERRLAGLRAMAVLAGGIGLALPLALVGDAWRWDFAEAGIGAALMMAGAAALPFRPLPGRDVWLWSRGAWCAAGGATVAYYFLWQAALLPLWLLEVTAAAGLVTFAVAMLRLRPSAASGGAAPATAGNA